MVKTLNKKQNSGRNTDELSKLKNVGPVTRENFRLLGIKTTEQLADQKADQLYEQLNTITGTRVDPCMCDVFSATIHEARTGEALPWWHFSAERKLQHNTNVPR